MQAGAGHALAEAAILEEVLLQAAKLLVQKVVDCLDQANDHVATDRGVTVLDALAEGIVGGIVDDLGLAAGEQVGVAAVGWDETTGRRRFLKKRTSGT
jgi:hypothetical protein